MECKLSRRECGAREGAEKAKNWLHIHERTLEAHGEPSIGTGRTSLPRPTLYKFLTGSTRPKKMSKI